MGQPLHQAVLVNKLDAPATLARVEEWLVAGALASTYPASI
jgi:hypothetical protein